ncbi:hypothetical protein [Actinomadura harenae]|uniref:Uncharacterized protein n=1 Tax=Actinomadura harenae TaxID=2483351 RepID=A0A3M2M0M2_9ACTN|nr:hypothetical protein [Actinomadura harenae]RMI43324.1 hypothetical protein EBO15_16725 [Actinomadura harenae]
MLTELLRLVAEAGPMAGWIVGVVLTLISCAVLAVLIFLGFTLRALLRCQDLATARLYLQALRAQLDFVRQLVRRGSR